MKPTGIVHRVLFENLGKGKKTVVSVEQNKFGKNQLKNSEGAMDFVKNNFDEGHNMFFEDVFQRYEGVFGNYNKRGIRVKRESKWYNICTYILV